jgi:hypothetical protein
MLGELSCPAVCGVRGILGLSKRWSLSADGTITGALVVSANHICVPPVRCGGRFHELRGGCC